MDTKKNVQVRKEMTKEKKSKLWIHRRSSNSQILQLSGIGHTHVLEPIDVIVTLREMLRIINVKSIFWEDF